MKGLKEMKKYYFLGNWFIENQTKLVEIKLGDIKINVLDNQSNGL
jgi:hypothetical protein